MKLRIFSILFLYFASSISFGADSRKIVLVTRDKREAGTIVNMWYEGFGSYKSIISTSGDRDGDGVPDDVEPELGTDPDDPCSFSSMYPDATGANCKPPPPPGEGDDPDDLDDPNDPDDPTNPGGNGNGGDGTGGGGSGGDGDDTGGGGGGGSGGGDGDDPGNGGNDDDGGDDEPPTDPTDLLRGIYSYLDRLIKAVYDTDANSSVKGLGDSLEGMSFDDFLKMGSEQSKTAQSIDSKLDSTIDIQYGMRDNILNQYEATKEMGNFIRDLINQDEKFMNDLFAQLDANASKDRSESIDKSLTKVTEQLSGQGEIVSATQSVGGRVKDLTEETERQTNAVHAVNESIGRLTDAVRQQSAATVEIDTSGIINNQVKAHSLWSKMQADSEVFYSRMTELMEARYLQGTDILKGFTAFGTDFDGTLALWEQQRQEQAAQAAAQQRLQEEQIATQKKIQEQQEAFFTLISEEQAREWWPEDFADDVIAKQDEVIAAIKENSTSGAAMESLEDTILEVSQSSVDILNDVNESIKNQTESLARIDDLIDGIDLVNTNLVDDALFKQGMKEAIESYQEELNQTMTGLREVQIEILDAVKNIAVDRLIQQHKELSDRALQQEKELADRALQQEEELASLHDGRIDEVVGVVNTVEDQLARVNETLEKILDKTGTVAGGSGGGDTPGEDEEEGGDPWSAPEIEWEKPKKSDELAFAFDGGTVESDLTAALDDMGLSLDRLNNFSPKRFSVNYRIPVGGTWDSLRWEQRTFELDNPAPEAGSFFNDIKSFIHGIASAVVSLVFVMRTWRVIGGV